MKNIDFAGFCPFVGTYWIFHADFLPEFFSDQPLMTNDAVYTSWSPVRQSTSTIETAAPLVKYE